VASCAPLFHLRRIGCNVVSRKVKSSDRGFFCLRRLDLFDSFPAWTGVSFILALLPTWWLNRLSSPFVHMSFARLLFVRTLCLSSSLLFLLALPFITAPEMRSSPPTQFSGPVIQPSFLFRPFLHFPIPSVSLIQRDPLLFLFAILRTSRVNPRLPPLVLLPRFCDIPIFSRFSFFMLAILWSEVLLLFTVPRPRIPTFLLFWFTSFAVAPSSLFPGTSFLFTLLGSAIYIPLCMPGLQPRSPSFLPSAPSVDLSTGRPVLLVLKRVFDLTLSARATRASKFPRIPPLLFVPGPRFLPF